MEPLLKRLQGAVVIADGAMGTVLQDMGLHPPFDMACLTHPDWVVAVHKRYLDAGAELLETITYSSNRVKLQPYDLQEKVVELNRQAVRLARAASGGRAYVMAAVGPVGRPLAPVGTIPNEVAEEAFREQIGALLEEEPDGLLLETFYDMHEFRLAVRIAREMTSLPIIASKTFIEDGDTLAAGLPERVAAEVSQWGVDAVGSNCTIGPQRMLDVVRQIAGATNLPICVMPTPGLPQLVRGRIMYDTTPEYFAKYCARLVEAGANIVGGCCGVTPEHIRAVASVIGGKQPGKRSAITVVHEEERASLPQAEPSNFAQKLGQKFLVAVELDLPRGLDLGRVLQGARALAKSGADVIDISDGARARLRMNPVAVSHAIQQECGIEVMMHFSCRDRNLLAIQADLLGAHALGIRNILAVTGDPAQIGDYPTATSVFDLDSVGLVRVLRRMNEGVDMAGNSIGIRTNFTIAVAFDPGARDFDAEVERLRRKADAGAQVVYTQPLFDRAITERAVEVCSRLGLPMLVGVLPLRSSRHAEFMHNEVPGIHVPEWLRKQMEDVEERDAGELGIALARDYVAEVKDLVQGVYLLPPFGHYATATAVMEVLGPR